MPRHSCHHTRVAHPREVREIPIEVKDGSQSTHQAGRYFPVQGTPHCVAVMTEGRRYSCETAADTLKWINDIINFLNPYFSIFINARVVHFFKDRVWESVNAEWIDCLRREPAQNLLLIPFGVVQDQWPASLKDFILKLRSMVFCQEQADINMALPAPAPTHTLPDSSVMPSAPNFESLPDGSNDIEEEMIRAAIEASKREAEENYSNHELGGQVELSDSGPNPRQSFLEDPELAHAVLLSLKVHR